MKELKNHEMINVVGGDCDCSCIAKHAMGGYYMPMGMRANANVCKNLCKRRRASYDYECVKASEELTSKTSKLPPAPGPSGSSAGASSSLSSGIATTSSESLSSQCTMF